MSREKQIEEMARVMANGRFIEPDRTQILLFAGEAETLYNAGYRKQSMGEWKQAYNSYPRYFCTHCNHLFNNKSFKYCPNCGARMKGGEG